MRCPWPGAVGLWSLGPKATPVSSPVAEAHGTPGAEEELEELRGRLRNILSGAYDQGVLEQA